MILGHLIPVEVVVGELFGVAVNVGAPLGRWPGPVVPGALDPRPPVHQRQPRQLVPVVDRVVGGFLRRPVDQVVLRQHPGHLGHTGNPVAVHPILPAGLACPAPLHGHSAAPGSPATAPKRRPITLIPRSARSAPMFGYSPICEAMSALPSPALPRDTRQPRLDRTHAPSIIIARSSQALSPAARRRSESAGPPATALQ